MNVLIGIVCIALGFVWLCVLPAYREAHNGFALDWVEFAQTFVSQLMIFSVTVLLGIYLILEGL